MQKKVLFAIGFAGLGGMVSPATAQAQDNVTVVVNDGKVKSNSISGVVYSADDNEPLIGA